MAIDEGRARLTGRIWQAIGQSGVDLTGLPRREQDKLVAAVADAMLVTLDEMLGEAAEASGATPALAVAAPTAATPSPDRGSAPAPARSEAPVAGGEQVVWEGRPFLALFEHYTVTTERVRIRRGLLNREVEDIELLRLQDVDLTQHLTERLVDIGDITLSSADRTDPVAVLRNVHNPVQVHEVIRRAWLDARQRHGFRFREEL